MIRRTFAALGELVLAVALIVASFWLWAQGLHTTEFPPVAPGVSAAPATHYSGPWLAGAIGAVVLAALLVIDAARCGRILAQGSR